MIGFFLIISLFGIGLILYGIWEVKHVYSEQHFADAEVVDFEPYRPSHFAVWAMAAVTGMAIPIVQFELETGEVKRLKLHNVTVIRNQLAAMPELDMGGRVQVTYFGKKPKEVLLTNHPLAQTPMKFSPVLLIGIVIALLGLGMLAFTIYYYYFT